MKSAVVLFFLLFSAACATNPADSRNRAANSLPEPPAPQTKQAVLVELFTSEG
jgi:hypothetical protein